MDPNDVPTGSIVVGIDGSPWSDQALDWATEQAAEEHRALVLVHAVPPLGAQSYGLYPGTAFDVGQVERDARAGARSLLEGAEARARVLSPDVVCHTVIASSDPRSALIDLGEQAAMVVVGSRGRGPVASLLLGSVSVSVSSHATCPVVVCRETPSLRPGGGVLVGVDGSADSATAIEFAYRLASFRALPLTVLHCYWDAASVVTAGVVPPSVDLSITQALVSESVAGMAEKFPDVTVEVRLARGSADQHLIAASPDYDLLVVGHRRMGRLRELLYDAVAPAVLEHARGNVVVVPSRWPDER